MEKKQDSYQNTKEGKQHPILSKKIQFTSENDFFSDNP